MKIVVIGGTGTIGRAIVEEMQPRHEIVAAGRSHGDRQVDITDPASVQALFDHIGRFDALIAALIAGLPRCRLIAVCSSAAAAPIALGEPPPA